jgi:hypothetical protein
MVRKVINNNTPLSRDFPEVFHYTNVAAFENIYKEQKFRATHYEDLNDASEMKRFSLKVYDFIRPTIRELVVNRMLCNAEGAIEINRHGGIDNLVNKEATTLLDIFHNSTFGARELQPFVCSFCSHGAQSYEAKHGLLSQWRGYGADGGVAIVLDTLCIENRLQHEKTIFAHPINHIGDVIYDNDDARILNEFHKVFDFFRQFFNGGCAIPSSTDTDPEIFFNFLFGTTLVKHHAFHEENEIRIVVSPRTSKNSLFSNSGHDSKPSKIVLYAQRGNREVRYIDLFGDAPLLIKRIIVGPSRIQNLNYQKISDQVKHDGIEVFKSEIPFLG